MEYPNISIIMPTYNRAKLLPNIIGLIQSQSYDNFELIVVNDGSSDDSAEILHNLANNDKRIKVINKKNEGVSSARNAGIEMALGKYIIFIEDDDFIESDYLKDLMFQAEGDPDLVIDSFAKKLDDGSLQIFQYPLFCSYTCAETIDFLFGKMQSKAYCFFPYGKRFKNDIIKRHNIRFKTNISLGEDRPFILDYLKFAESLCIINCHNYIINNTDVNRLSSCNKSLDYLWQNFRENYTLLVDYANHFNNLKIKKYADNFLAEKITYYMLLTNTSLKVNNFDCHFYELRQKLKSIDIMNIKDRKVRITTLMIRMIGFVWTRTLLKYIVH